MLTSCAADLEDLIKQALLALRECLPNDAELTDKVHLFTCVCIRMCVYSLGYIKRMQLARQLKASCVVYSLRLPCIWIVSNSSIYHWQSALGAFSIIRYGAYSNHVCNRGL